MTKTMHRVLVSLKLPSNASELVIRAKGIVEAMTGNSWFPAPVPSLAKVKAATAALYKAEAATLLRTKGLTGVRDDARKKLKDLLLRLKGYVQAVANDNPGFEVTIIKSAGMDVVERPSVNKPYFDVLPGDVSGSVWLVAKAIAKQASYLWELSEDSGKTWVRIRRTNQAKTLVEDLVPGKRYGFRFQGVTSRFTTNWCDAVFYVVQ